MSWQPCVLSKSRIPQEMAFEHPAHFVALGSHVSCEVDTIGTAFVRYCLMSERTAVSKADPPLAILWGSQHPASVSIN
jgi:hypothetical protein